MSSVFIQSFRLASVLLATVLLLSCDSGGKRRYHEVVELPPQETLPSEVHPGGAMGALPGGMREASAPPITWQTPDSWREKVGSGMRIASFAPAAADTGAFDCSVTSLGGDAGGAVANASRWLEQLKLNLGPEQIRKFIADSESLKTADGVAAQFLDFTQLTKEGAPSMLAAIVPQPSRTVFVKLTAQHAVAQQQRSPLRALVQSIRTNAPAPRSGSQSKLSWQAPEGWTERPASGMRTGEFHLDGGELVCTIVSLNGDGGGLASNVNRWLDQMKVTVSPAELHEIVSQSTSMTSDGGIHLQLFDLTAHATSDDAEAMLVAVAALPQRTVFIKLPGRKAKVTPHLPKFTQLCRSLSGATYPTTE